MRGRRPSGLTCKRVVVTLTAIVTIVAVVGYLIVWIPGLPGPHHGAYLARGSLHNIYGGLEYYDRASGHLPPATATDPESGEPVSWRIEVYQSWVRLGHISAPQTSGDTSIDYDRQEPWTDPGNLRLQDLGAWLFRYTQTDPGPNGMAGYYTSYYKAITGAGTAFDSATPPSLRQLPKGLILVVRVESSDTHWMEPGDLSIEEVAPSEKARKLLLGRHGYVVLFADGEGWVLSGELPFSDLCKFFTVAGAKQFDRERVLGPYRVLP
jgi:hypothetical protein